MAKGDMLAPDDVKEERLTIRISRSMKAAIMAAAGVRGASAWLMEAAVEKLSRQGIHVGTGPGKATATISNHRVTVATPGDFKHPTVGDVLDARGGHSPGRESDVAPLSKPPGSYKPIPRQGKRR